MELHSSHFGGLWEANIVHETHFIEGSEISYHELRRVNYVGDTNRSSSEFTWKLIQSLRNKFWNRWSTEYLTHLQTRAKWSVQNPNLMENQLVLLKDPNTKPLDWPMRRILEIFPGSDGLVRVVNVKTSSGILKRTITKVVPLPIPDDPATVEHTI
ncbi:integrase catalytic domain-containing protein [Trichonephila inaurata madagascariensis]|uniref:Integrase catalytic domain-containing protein n=1 Tax=Trichonephila inaurata madagascariensis TaxID=2747483 RepID=A0A8X6YJ32_9ARAC|nr:integrase catalytic domain-containing protein [Trichonephila inaurata madagascariensis]